MPAETKDGKPAETKAGKLIATLLDNRLDKEQRALMMHQIAHHEPDHVMEVFADVLSAADSSDAAASERLAELQGAIESLKQGPQRVLTFVSQDKNQPTRAEVTMQDGTIAIIPAADPSILKTLDCGDDVLVTGDGSAILGKHESGDLKKTGEQAVFIRRYSDRWAEISHRDERSIFLMTKVVIDLCDKGEIPDGSTVLVCTRRCLVIDFIKPVEGVCRYRFLCKEKVPDIIIERDIGEPPQCLFDIMDHIDQEMRNPELSKQYRINRSLTRLFVGPSGTGKTLGVQGLIRGIYDRMSTWTGAPIEELPPRVFRLRVPQVLSKWLGESDQNLDRFFEEIEEVADQLFEWNGKTYQLPAIGIFEEADALARRRGMDHDGIYDRIQTTLLQRLDNTYAPMKEKLMLFLFTSNLQEMLDPAFIRRAGGKVEYFDRLGQEGFCDVLRKQMRDRKISSKIKAVKTTKNKDGQVEAVIEEVSHWLFNGDDKGQIQIKFAVPAGADQKIETKFRRDFLTGALIGRAVEAACIDACRKEAQKAKQPGLDSEMVMVSLTQQLNALFDSLDVTNIAQHILVKQGTRIIDIRRI